MKFKTDENLPEEAAKLLTDAGHGASTILAESMGGDPDPDVASVCLAESRVLVTLDLGFADIRAYPPEEYPGLIVLRPGRRSKTRVMDMVGKIPPMLGARRGRAVDRGGGSRKDPGCERITSKPLRSIFRRPGWQQYGAGEILLPRGITEVILVA